MGTAISSDGKELYVSTGRGNTVAIIDTAKNAVATTIPVGNRAWGIARSIPAARSFTLQTAHQTTSPSSISNRAKNCIGSKSAMALGALQL